MAQQWKVTLDCGCIVMEPIEDVPDVGVDWCCPDHGDEVVSIKVARVTEATAPSRAPSEETT